MTSRAPWSIRAKCKQMMAISECLLFTGRYSSSGCLQSMICGKEILAQAVASAHMKALIREEA
eukprot:1140989-Pelagomonas_calceolata.AAC.2